MKRMNRAAYQRWLRETAKPMPELGKTPHDDRRFALFDALPKELRRVIAHNTDASRKLIAEVYKKYKARQKVKSIIAFIENKGVEVEARNPAEREAAQKFLKDIGL